MINLKWTGSKKFQKLHLLTFLDDIYGLYIGSLHNSLITTWTTIIMRVNNVL